MSQAVADKSLINPKLIVPFMNATRDVFKTMANVETTVDRPYVKKTTASTYDVCGIIGFSGEVSGSVVLSFSDSAALQLVEAFAGSRLERDTPDFADAIGELANMVAGSAKQRLGMVASITVPSVVIGNGYAVTNMSKTPCLVIPCQSPFGAFAVEVCIQQNVAI